MCLDKNVFDVFVEKYLTLDKIVAKNNDKFHNAFFLINKQFFLPLSSHQTTTFFKTCTKHFMLFTFFTVRKMIFLDCIILTTTSFLQYLWSQSCFADFRIGQNFISRVVPHDIVHRCEQYIVLFNDESMSQSMKIVYDIKHLTSIFRTLIFVMWLMLSKLSKKIAFKFINCNTTKAKSFISVF